MKTALTMHHRATSALPRLLVLLLLFCLPAAAWAGTTGKVAGRILDASTGEPLAYANIVLLGTNLGAATDDSGRYIILNVPPGEYSMRADYLGYSSSTTTGVRVTIDHTTRLQIQLSEQILEMEEGAIVIADRELFQRDLTASQSVVGAERIEATPATELGDLLELQAGVTTDAGGGIHFRGGRSGEVAFMVDGMSFTDAFNGSQAMAVENESIQEIQVISGAFNAEYGQAMSGVVNIVTKEGGSAWGGTFQSYFGDFVSNNDKLFWNIEDLSPGAIQNYQGSVSGPIWGDKLNIFATARSLDNDGYLYGHRVFNFFDVAYFPSNEGEEAWRMVPTGDSTFVAMNPYRKYTAQAKLTFKPLNSLKLRYNILYEDFKSQSYDHFYRLNPDGRPTYYKEAQHHTVTSTWTIGSSARTFTDFGISYLNNKERRYNFEDQLDPRNFFVTFRDNVPPHGWSYSTGGLTADWWNERTKQYVVKADITSQINYSNMLKAGLELRQYSYRQFGRRLVNDGASFEYVEEPKVKPTQISAYFQDKIEMADIILNVGLRLDRFDPKGLVPSDPKDPNADAPLRGLFEHDSGRIVGFDSLGSPVYEGHAYDVPWDSPSAADWRRPFMYEETTVKYQLSPRLGLSYPITDAGGIHVSYGHFLQIPGFDQIYSNPEWNLGSGTGVTALMGNPDINAQKTVQYEMGVQQQIGDGGRLTADFFFRDFRDLLATDRIVETYRAGTKYSQYSNRDQGNARGIAVSLSDDRDSFFWSIDYTFQIAEGLASDANEAYNRAQKNEEPLPQLVPLGWDRRHNLNAQFGLGAHAWGVTALANLWSPTPYTPDIGQVGVAVEHAGRIPPYYNVDLKAHYDWRVLNQTFQLFVNVFNLLDRQNEESVFADTGRATESLDALEAEELSTEFVNTVESWFSDPSRFSAPRQVHLGFKVNF